METTTLVLPKEIRHNKVGFEALTRLLTCQVMAIGKSVMEIRSMIALARLLGGGYHVSLSFHNVTLLTSAFLNNAIGRLYGKFNSEEIETRLTYSDIEADDKIMVEAVIDNAKKFFKDPEGYR